MLDQNKYKNVYKTKLEAIVEFNFFKLKLTWDKYIIQ